MLIAPSILSVYSSKLSESLDILNELKVDYLHLDVMDNQFVPNLTFDYNLIEKIRNETKLVLDTHLMITTAEEDYQKYIDSGTDILTFHYEAVVNPHELLLKIKKTGIKAGISIKPDTNPHVLDEMLKDIDIILVMSVEPGFGGQAFKENAIDKIKYFNEQRKKNNYNYLIEVDGGINHSNGIAVSEVGCDIIVVGSYLMKSENIRETYHRLKSI